MVYSAEEVGELLGGMSRRTVYRRMTDGDIPSFMLGGMRVVTHDDLVAYVERCRTESKDGAA